jgi:hypothetical protein
LRDRRARSTCNHVSSEPLATVCELRCSFARIADVNGTMQTRRPSAAAVNRLVCVRSCDWNVAHTRATRLIIPSLLTLKSKASEARLRFDGSSPGGGVLYILIGRDVEATHDRRGPQRNIASPPRRPRSRHCPRPSLTSGTATERADQPSNRPMWRP